MGKLIDADALREEFRRDIMGGLNWDRILREAKTVDAVPVRRGRWVPKFNGNFKGGAYWYECSECGHTVPGGLQSGKIFCKNCGADMREDGDNG